MDYEQNLESTAPDNDLREIFSKTWSIATAKQQDRLFLLYILRSLELIHRQIRTELFEPSLPETRNDLYQLVKDIEEKGGWPYIERMRLQELLQNLPLDRNEEIPSNQEKV